MFESSVLSRCTKVLGICVAFGVFFSGPAIAEGLNLELGNTPSRALENAAVLQNDPIVTAQLIVGHVLMNEDGQRIGDIVDVVRDKASKTPYAVVAVEPSGQKAKEITVPLADIEVMPQEVMVQSGLDVGDYAAMPAYMPGAYTSIVHAG